jgi:hypothetical protein
MQDTNVVSVQLTKQNVFDTAPLKEPVYNKIQTDFHATITEVNQILKKSLLPVQLQDDIVFKRVAVLTFIIFFGCLLLFLAPFLQWPYYSLFEYDREIFFVVMGSQCVMLLVAIALVMYWLTTSKRRMVMVKTDVQNNVDTLLKKENNSKYLSKGVQWEFEWAPPTTGIREEAEPVLLIFYNE